VAAGRRPGGPAGVAGRPGREPPRRECVRKRGGYNEAPRPGQADLNENGPVPVPRRGCIPEPRVAASAHPGDVGAPGGVDVDPGCARSPRPPRVRCATLGSGTQPLRGTNTARLCPQGVLRDPGLWSTTPSG